VTKKKVVVAVEDEAASDEVIESDVAEVMAGVAGPEVEIADSGSPGREDPNEMGAQVVVTIGASGAPMTFDSPICCEIQSIAIRVNQAFGPDSRYKGRNVVAYLDVKPRNAELRIPVPGGMDGLSLEETIEALLGPLVQVAEDVVTEAEKREGVKEREIVDRLVARAEASDKPKLPPQQFG